MDVTATSSRDSRGVPKIQDVWRALRGIKPKTATRTYANAIPAKATGRLMGFSSSADAELQSSLTNLRTRSRMLVRDAAYAKNAKRVVVNNVIGNGIRLQAMTMTVRGGLNTRQNAGIEDAFADWCLATSCHTGGSVHFHDLERMVMGQVFEAGEVFIRIHRSKFGDSKVPIALEMIEGERLADGVPAGMDIQGTLRLGIEVDNFSRPISYLIRSLHPGDIRANYSVTQDTVTRVMAEDIIHLKITDRWPQSRGEPWLHAVAEKLQDMNGYSEAEIIAARGAAAYIGTIETPEGNTSLAEEGHDGHWKMDVEPGTWMKLNPGEEAKFVSPNRPNSALDPFMRFMLREVAAGAGLSYESLSKDYAQSNYSSSRLALLDDRDNWKSLQLWFIRSFRIPLHKQWLKAAVYAQAIPEVPVMAYALAPEKFETVRMRPRGWSWIDPTKEVAAYKEAIKAGLTTVEKVIGFTSDGDDLEDVMQSRAAELEYMDEENLAFDTSPAVYVPAQTRGQMLIGPDGTVVSAVSQMPAAPGATGVPVAAAAPAPTAPIDPDDGQEPEEDSEAEGEDEGRAANILTLRRRNRND